jgi:hypothetical protein
MVPRLLQYAQDMLLEAEWRHSSFSQKTEKLAPEASFMWLCESQQSSTRAGGPQQVPDPTAESCKATEVTEGDDRKPKD